ncbi:lipase esterase protein, partial [Lasius niger]
MAGKVGPGSGDLTPTVHGALPGYPSLASCSAVPTLSEVWEPRKPTLCGVESDQSDESDVISKDCDTVRDKPTDSQYRHDNQAGSSGDVGSRGDPFPPLTAVSGKRRAGNRANVKVSPYPLTKKERESSRSRFPSLIRREEADEGDEIPTRRSGKRSTRRLVSASDGEEDVVLLDEKLISIEEKRGRGRPPTHGRFVGWAKAKADMAEME